MFVDIYTIVLLFITGLFVSKVLIILGLKLPLKVKEYANGCDTCNEKYEIWELIPVISYFINKGKCPYCQKKISIFYPFLELLTGIMFASSYLLYGFNYEMFCMLIIISLLIIIYVSDFKYYIILDSSLVVSGLLILLLKLIYFGFKTFLLSIASGFLLFIFMLFVKKIGDVIFKKESLGGGDVKLALIFGFALGVRLSIVAIIIGCFMAFPYAIYSSLSNRNREIAFGPFLITAFFLVFLFMKPILSFLNIIFINY